MINKRDINKLRTPEDLERKYNLNDILTLKENYELQKNGLNKVENELNGFVIATGKNLKELQDQVDGNITTWFYSGVPTASNEPASTWITDTEKNNHLGDLYYDKDTGYAYRYSLDNATYSWIKITDNDVTQALAIANSAKDTADSKRRVFVVQPTTPYDVGDLWIKDEELYRCQTTKASSETFEENDWIIATKYTDDTKANQVGENLTILSGTVTEIKENVDSLSSTMTNTTELVNEQGEKIGDLQVQQSQVTQTVNDFDVSVKNIQKTLETTNGTVSSLEGKVTDMNFNFSTKGLAIGTTTDVNNSLFDNTGIKVFNYEKLTAIFNYKGSGIEKLIVTGSSQIGYFKTEKSTKTYLLDRTQVTKKANKHFFLKELIEDLEDLEG